MILKSITLKKKYYIQSTNGFFSEFNTLKEVRKYGRLQILQESKYSYIYTKNHQLKESFTYNQKEERIKHELHA